MKIHTVTEICALRFRGQLMELYSVRIVRAYVDPTKAQAAADHLMASRDLESSRGHETSYEVMVVELET